MYHTILVPLDGSPRAEAILPAVIELAHKFESKVLLAQVVEPMATQISPQQSIKIDVEGVQAREQEARAYLTTKANELRGDGVKAVEVFVLYGNVVEALIRLADSEEVTLIAVGSHGRGGLGNLLFGSVTIGLMNRSIQPLLVVRAS